MILKKLVEEDYFLSLVRENDQKNSENDDDLDSLFSFNPLADIDEIETNQDDMLIKQTLALGIEKYSKLVVVVGSFSSGKTSIINMITGLNLPTDTIENTSVIVEISRSTKKHLILYYLGQMPRKEPFRLERITQLVNKGISSRVKNNKLKRKLIKIRICFPIKNINEDTLIVDTPGVNGLEYSEQFEAVTLPYIKQVPKDKMKVIWVQSLERAQPSRNEFEIIRKLLVYGNSKTFIGTKYDYFLTKSNWKELVDLYTKPAYEVLDDQKKSIYEVFNSNLFIMYLNQNQNFVKSLNGEKEYSKISKDLVEEWFGTTQSEAKDLYRSLAQRLSDAFDQKALINLEEFRQGINSWPKSVSENLEIQNVFSRVIYDVAKGAYTFDKNNDPIILEALLQVNEHLFSKLAQEIINKLTNEYYKYLEHDLGIINLKAFALSIDMKDELILFDLFNKISLRLFLANSQTALESKIASQFFELKQYLLSNSKQNPKDALLVKSHFFSPSQFSFILTWLAEYYFSNLNQLVKTIYRRVNDKHLNYDNH